MSSPVWQLEGWLARLQIGRFTGQADLLAPEKGLALRTSESDCAALNILCVDLPGPAPTADSPPSDCYVRGQDLIVVYAQAGPRPTRVEAYWRASQPSAESLSVELQVSVQTSLLESAPDIVVHSKLPATTTARLQAPPESAFAPLASASKPVLLTPDEGPGCLLFSPLTGACSYAEMIHPSDFRRDELSPAADSVVLRHRLFYGALEKGVILRGRVRGMLLPREQDQSAAAAAFAAFCESPPPLTT